MKNPLLLFVSLTLLFSSCSVKTIYQVVNTKSDSIDSTYNFENSEINCSYDFWDPKSGSPFRFKLYNKTNNPIYLDWSKSSFIINGQSFDYFQEATFSESKILAKSSTNIFQNRQNLSSNTTAAQINSVQSYKQKKVQHIPAQSYIEFKLNSGAMEMIKGCDYKINGNERFKEFNFEKTNSPYIFRNYLSYTNKENETDFKIIDNEFWVNKIYMMNESTFMGDRKSIDNCNNTKSYTYSYPFKSKKNFYYEKSEKGTNPLAVVFGVAGAVVLISLLALAR